MDLWQSPGDLRTVKLRDSDRTGSMLVSDRLDYGKVDVPCPRCDRQVATPLGRLRSRFALACWGFGNLFTADPAPIEQTLKDTSTWLSKLKAKPDENEPLPFISQNGKIELNDLRQLE